VLEEAEEGWKRQNEIWNYPLTSLFSMKRRRRRGRRGYLRKFIYR
jgi:hypothetical protein